VTTNFYIGFAVFLAMFVVLVASIIRYSRRLGRDGRRRSGRGGPRG
jgi:hypothetical protein